MDRRKGVVSDIKSPPQPYGLQERRALVYITSCKHRQSETDSQPDRPTYNDGHRAKVSDLESPPPCQVGFRRGGLYIRSCSAKHSVALYVQCTVYYNRYGMYSILYASYCDACFSRLATGCSGVNSAVGAVGRATNNINYPDPLPRAASNYNTTSDIIFYCGELKLHPTCAAMDNVKICKKHALYVFLNCPLPPSPAP